MRTFGPLILRRRFEQDNAREQLATVEKMLETCPETDLIGKRNLLWLRGKLLLRSEGKEVNDGDP